MKDEVPRGGRLIKSLHHRSPENEKPRFPAAPGELVPAASTFLGTTRVTHERDPRVEQARGRGRRCPCARGRRGRRAQAAGLPATAAGSVRGPDSPGSDAHGACGDSRTSQPRPDEAAGLRAQQQERGGGVSPTGPREGRQSLPGSDRRPLPEPEGTAALGA